MMELIDTHCHLTSEELVENLEEVLDRSRAQGVKEWITIGTDLAHSQAAVALAQRIEGLRAVVGLHPHDAKHLTDDYMQQLRALAGQAEVVAIGETGLDYHYEFSSRTAQIEAFERHLALAAEMKLPVVIHTREAYDDTLDVLDGFRDRLDRVVLHCFSGNAEEASRALDRGFTLSFTGVVTFKSADEIRAAARIVPLERLMVETDCPYMSPVPMRKQRINEPALLVHTARFLAELREMDPIEFAQRTTENARRFFKLERIIRATG
jgi:TatD DNase family protein